MSMPFRNTDKTLSVYPVHSIVSIFDKVEDAEAALSDLDKEGFGDEVVYARGGKAQKLEQSSNQGFLAQVYRALQSVMSDELASKRLYEKKIQEGASFILVPLTGAGDVDRVAAIFRAHNVTLATYLGRTSFRDL